MASPWIRLALIAIGLFIGVGHLERGDPLGWVLIGGVALLVYGYFRYGTVRWALAAYRFGDIERVRSRLAHTPFPGLLSSGSRAYHTWMRGVVAFRDRDLDTARVRLIAAYEGRLRTARDRASVALILAALERDSGHEDKALRWAQESRRHWRDPDLERVMESLGLEEE